MKLRMKRPGEAVELQLTSMIDIIFLLLAFFVMTFKIVTPEGDFNIKMPLEAPSQSRPDPDAMVIDIRLVADSSGNLSNIVFQNRSMGRSFSRLRREMIDFIGPDAGPAALSQIEVKIDADYRLRYENVVEAITAVTGYVNEQGRVVKLVEKVRFAPPRQ